MDLSDQELIAATRQRQSIGAHLVCLDRDGMAGLARWLAGEEEGVTKPSRSLAADTRADPGHDPLSIPLSARWHFHAPEVPREHPDRLVALRDGVPQATYPELIRDLMGRGVGIAVSGGKQGHVAAAMIGWTLRQVGLDPTLLLRSGGPQLGSRTQLGRGRHAVVDVTETIDSVLDGPPGPAVAVLLDLTRRVDSGVLGRVVECVGPAGYVLAGMRDPSVPLATSVEATRFETMSLERGSTWWGTDLREDRGRFRFRAFHRGRFAAEIHLRLPGRSSVLSALATVAVCERIEVPTREIKQALEEFAGVSRGFESRGSYRGVTLVDDDSVEALDVAEAVNLARVVHGRRRLWVIFAPAGPPRVDTALALAYADHVMIVQAAVDAVDWTGMLEEAGVVARHVASLDEALADLDRHLEPGDVLLTLGAGEVGTIADAFLRRLPHDRQGR
jgi:UDP-N-acetylmuramate--alanine ligase